VKVYFASMPVLAIVGAALLPIGVIALPAPSVIQVAQNAGDPVALVNPEQPIQIEVVNAGSAPITCQLTQPPTDNRRVIPGSNVTFGTTHTSYLPLPVNLLVSPEEQNVGLGLAVTVSENVVKVVVDEARSDIPGSTSMRISLDGGIYVY